MIYLPSEQARELEREYSIRLRDIKRDYMERRNDLEEDFSQRMYETYIEIRSQRLSL